jgi:hypothetical protein
MEAELLLVRGWFLVGGVDEEFGQCCGRHGFGDGGSNGVFFFWRMKGWEGWWRGWDMVWWFVREDRWCFMSGFISLRGEVAGLIKREL